MFCPHCSRAILDDSKFCEFCGRAVTPLTPAAPETPAVSAAPEVAAESRLGPIWSTEATAESSATEGAATAPLAIETPPAPSSAPARSPYLPLQPRASARSHYAGFWRRFFAFLLDLFAISCVEGILIQLGVITQLPDQPSLQQSLTFLAYALPAYWAYYALMESSPWQATLGKRALDLAVTDLEEKRISILRASGRFFGKLVSFSILGIGFLTIAFTTRRQALHDLLAGCLVIRRV
jgi:uncharacterized RDD family membrane protein YckC